MIIYFASSFSFTEEEIDGSGLNYITDEELKTLIPKIGKRAKFRALVDNVSNFNAKLYHSMLRLF